MSMGRGVGRVLCGGGDGGGRAWTPAIDIRNDTCALEKRTSGEKLPLRVGEHASEPRRTQLVDDQLDGHDTGFQFTLVSRSRSEYSIDSRRGHNH